MQPLKGLLQTFVVTPSGVIQMQPLKGLLQTFVVTLLLSHFNGNALKVAIQRSEQFVPPFASRVNACANRLNWLLWI